MELLRATQTWQQAGAYYVRIQAMARKPAKDVDLQWLIQNNHPPKTVDLPLDMEASTRHAGDQPVLYL